MRKSLLSVFGVGVVATGCLLVTTGFVTAQAKKATTHKKSTLTGSFFLRWRSEKKPLSGKRAAAKSTPPKLVKVDFDRDVRPILAENCFACHGFDANKRQAGLRLDKGEVALGKLPSGSIAIVPGKPQASALYQRVAAHSMPPPSFEKKLTEKQIVTLRRWIEQGGQYAPHWAFVPPKRPALPTVQNAKWVRNPIDRFILAKLEQKGLKPSPEADKRTLIRRVTFDLTGLPPTPAEVSAFLADTSPTAYENVVDRLLASPHYGERMALAWLDLARYADTHGFHIDSQRDMWRWRDWVIEAYNRNLPYDQFTIQQLAGDLLPNATLDQKIATGFNRNHPINFEGGAIPEEYAAAYILDRIDTTATTFMGLTMRCGQCHDHKYDPITQKDYYRFYAFFNNVPEQGLDGQNGNAAPFLKAPLPGQQEQLDQYKQKVAEAEQAVKTRATEAAPALAAWIKETAPQLENAPTLANGLIAHYAFDEGKGEQIADALGKQPAGILHGKATWGQGKLGGALRFDGSTYIEAGTSVTLERTDKFSYGAWVFPTSGEAGAVLSRMDDGADYRGWDLYLSDGRAYVHIVNKWDSNALRVNTKNQFELNQWHHIFATYDGSSKADGIRIYVDGKPAELDITHNNLTDTIQTPKPLHIGRRNPGAVFKGMIDEARIYKRELSAEEVTQLVGSDTIQPLLTTPEAKRTQEQKDALAKYYLETSDESYKKLTADLAEARKKRDAFDASIPTTMVMEEMPKPRETFMLVRGQYDHKGDKVTPGTPEFLPAPPTGEPMNRLALAKWLVNPSHPLTSRVAVNRYWQMLFGSGIVRTPENFGTQGDLPTHPELLDWLATEFIRTGWDVKGMLRLLVTSATYRQSSKETPLLKEKDPENLLLARAPRYRLPAEFVRDEALAVSGLLVPKIGGPSVKPYHPAGLWEELSIDPNSTSFSAQRYVQDHGESLYRRSMYTFWKRTVPPPSLQTFDAPEREYCVVRRSVTNTPLQALILMDDPTYVEAARKLAERMMTEGGSIPQARITFAYQLVMARPASSAEVRVLVDALNAQIARFHSDKAAAEKLLGVGESKRNEKLDAAELAAWTTVASIILNLDETITKG